MYQQFGKVHTIDTNCTDDGAVYESVRKAMLPSVAFIIGPLGSGKTTIANAICAKTNMKAISYPTFCHEKGLCEIEGEAATMAFIKQLSTEICPRILIEGFPRTEMQAKFFISNCVRPSHVFVLNCSKDVC